MKQTTDQTSVEAIRERLTHVQERIAQACERAGREADEITLVSVSKTFSLQAIANAYQLGLRHFGENRARQLRDKARERPGAFKGGDLTWRMVGHLQTNKAKFIARHADWFDALDRPALAEELNKRAGYNERTIPCLVQVNITGQEQKYGLSPEDTHAFLDRCAEYERLDVRGLMAMASFIEGPEDRERVREEFRRARELFETYDARNNPQVKMEELSLGMSNDFEIAIEEGSTMIRLGSALFGPRDYE
ncbi:MAG: YggS family pyridoxal phosphate-dependent enzyme [Salinivenus sp.]